MLRRIVLFLVACLAWSGPGFTDDAQLPSDHGYLLIRVQLTARERVELLEMSNVETGTAVKIRQESFQAAGLNAWMALVAVPGGRYFLSEYQPKFGISASEVQVLANRNRRSDPGSENNIFEIVPGVVNYVGDWTMRTDSTRRMRLIPTIEFDKSTLERYVAQYADYASRYELYLSAMGQKAISLKELAKN